MIDWTLMSGQLHLVQRQAWPARPDPSSLCQTSQCTSLILIDIRHCTEERTASVASVVIVTGLADADAVTTDGVDVSTFVSRRTITVQPHLRRCTIHDNNTAENTRQYWSQNVLK